CIPILTHKQTNTHTHTPTNAGNNNNNNNNNNKRKKIMGLGGSELYSAHMPQAQQDSPLAISRLFSVPLIKS
ncbi:hypothetical protein ACQP3F_34210, partial [Escherichia coli]